MTFDVSSWSFTSAADAKDTEVVVSLDGEELGSFALDNAPPAALPGFDDQGKATVTVTLPADTPAGTAVLTLTGETTGTTTTVPVEVEAGEPAPTTVTATAENIPYGTAGEVEVDVDSERPLSGTVEVRDGTRVLGTAMLAEDGTATVTLPPRSLPVGTHQLTVAYSGDAANQPSTGTVTVAGGQGDADDGDRRGSQPRHHQDAGRPDGDALGARPDRQWRGCGCTSTVTTTCGRCRTGA